MRKFHARKIIKSEVDTATMPNVWWQVLTLRDHAIDVSNKNIVEFVILMAPEFADQWPSIEPIETLYRYILGLVLLLIFILCTASSYEENKWEFKAMAFVPQKSFESDQLAIFQAVPSSS